MDFLLQVQAIGGLIACILIYKLWIARCKIYKRKCKEAPKVPGAWPVIGHLHLLRENRPFYQILGTMADKYGPAFILRLGMRKIFVVSSWELAKDCFTTNDKALATHPNSAAGEYLGYNYTMFGFAPYGPYWRDVRKMATLHLLSNTHLEKLGHVRALVIDTQIKGLYELWVQRGQSHVEVEMKPWFLELTFNVITMMVAGKQYFRTISADEENEAHRLRKAIDEFFRLVMAFVASDVFPFLKWMDFKGHKRAMKKVAKELDSIIITFLEEHRRKRDSDEDRGEKDFMDVLLSIMEGSQFSGYDPDTTIKSNSLALIIGGTDTTGTTLAVALSLMLNNPEVLNKAQEELDNHVGKNRNVEESDIKNLVYLQAIIKETLRLSPTTSQLPPHEAMEDCLIGGFHVPSGTSVLVNNWKMHRDPSVWSNPTKFLPERFLTKHINVDVRGQQFEYIPFGSGRRLCSGISFALHVMHLTLARLLHGFDLAPATEKPIDVESLRIGNTTSTPVEILISPRLPPKLYEMV